MLSKSPPSFRPTLERWTPEPAVRALFFDAPTAAAGVSALLSAHEVGAALEVLPMLLPRRFCVVWVCDCFRQLALAAGEDVAAADRVALALAERWLREPTDAHRQAAMAFAERGEFESAGDWLTAAVAWSTGSLAPPNLPVVAPPDYLTAKAAYAALVTYSTRAGADAGEWQKQCVTLALTTFNA